MISVMAVNFSGMVAAKTLQGALRAMARRDSGKKKKYFGISNQKTRKKNKGKFTCGEDGLAIKEGKIILFD